MGAGHYYRDVCVDTGSLGMRVDSCQSQCRQGMHMLVVVGVNMRGTHVAVAGINAGGTYIAVVIYFNTDEDTHACGCGSTRALLVMCMGWLTRHWWYR